MNSKIDMESFIKNKNIVVGVSGGIAAYKSAGLVRLLVKHGAIAKVAMTENACEFVRPLTFEALSGHEVCVRMFQKDNRGDGEIKHIKWSEDLDAAVIAPATANIIGKLATGVADNFLSTFAMAATCPIIICPSMNSNMYLSRAVSRNLRILKQDGFIVMEPGEGEMACKTSGPGRLPEPDEILDRIIRALAPNDFFEKNILVTAGPTREFIDPVRFISNPSSGKMGYAVATAASHRGGNVTLVTGPCALKDPFNVCVEKVETADQMAEAVFRKMENSDIIIKTAAVSDYKTARPAKNKIKKNANALALSLKKNIDILKEIGRRKTGQFLVGFAAETENLKKNAEKKMAEKKLDIIAGNIIGEAGSGFFSDTNRVTLFFKDGTIKELPVLSKHAVAHRILDCIAAAQT